MSEVPTRHRRKIRPARSAGGHRSEPLEQRLLLATISGLVYGDNDSNEVRGFFEDGLPELTVFIDSNENGALDSGEPTTLTDAKGRYSFKNLEVGTYYVGVVMPDGFGQTSPGIVGRVPTGFDIEVVFPDNSLTQEQKDVFVTAAQKWESVLSGDLPDVILGDGTVVDDVRIFATGPAIDGPFGILGQANFTAQRSIADGALPYEGFMQFDTADLAMLLAEQQLDEVIVHEMGHVLGVGTTWYGNGGVPAVATGFGSPGVAYIGPRGNLESNRLIGRNAAIETGGGGGTAFAHWDEETYVNELMTGFINSPGENPLSRLTVGNMEDMGYEVNFLGVDTYLGIGPLPEDLDNAFVDVARIPFEIGLRLKTDAENFDQASFGLRLNEKPSPFFLTVGPVIQTPGQDVRLLAEIDTTTTATFTGDADFRDRVIQVNFYAEANGVSGLQTGVDGDRLLIEDLDGTDGWDLTITTAEQPLGEQVYYARAFDRLYWTQDRAVTVDFIAAQPLPAKPESLRALALDARSIQLNWIDASTNENGFLLEVSKSPNFDVPPDITKIYLAPQDGTGPYNFELHIPEGELTTRHFRVRSFNTGGSSLFTGRVTARTLSREEVLIDNEDDSRVRNVGNWQTIVNRNASINLTYLRGTSGFVEYDPKRTTSTDYFVFLNNPNLTEPGRILVTVFSQDVPIDELTGEPIPFTMEIDQAASKGAEVQIGRFRFGPGSFVRIEHVSGTARVDTVRFLPVA